MIQRVSVLLMVLAVALFVLAPVSLGVEKEKDKNVAEGTFVKASDSKITIADKNDKEKTYDMAKDAKVTCDSKACTVDDLKKGVKVKLTLNEKGAAAAVDASTK